MLSKMKFTFLILVILGLLFGCDFIKGTKKKLLQERNKFINAIQENTDYIKNISKVLAFDPDILNTYKGLKERVNNLERIENQKEVFKEYGHKLKDIFNEIIKKYERDIGLPVSYNFYLPSAILWLIPEKPYGEDIPLESKAKEKPYVMETITKTKIISGLIIENNSLIFSSVTPIQSEVGEVLGAVEVWTNFLNILDHYLYRNPKTKIIVVLKKDFVNYFSSIPSDQITDKGFIFYSNIEKIDYKSVINKALSLKNEDLLDINNQKFIVIDLLDFSNKEMGKILFSSF